jgi:hypothetical protein
MQVVRQEQQEVKMIREDHRPGPVLERCFIKQRLCVMPETLQEQSFVYTTGLISLL